MSDPAKAQPRRAKRPIAFRLVLTCAALWLAAILATAAAGGVWLDVPFIAQPENGCGAASAAMVMQYWEIGQRRPHSARAEVAAIQQALYSKDAKGIFASDLEAYLKNSSYKTFAPSAASGRTCSRISRKAGRSSSRSHRRGHIMSCITLSSPESMRTEAASSSTILRRKNCYELPKPTSRGNGMMPEIGLFLSFRNSSLICALLFALSATSAGAQSVSVDTIKQLYGQKNWDEIVRKAPPSASNSPELDLYLGLALAQLQRWPEAKAALEDGERKNPREERFAVELAGVAYREKHLSEATRDLKRALKRKPDDSYALNFLGTIYLLRGNIEAALQNWNRVNAPRIAQIEEVPQPRLREPLLERAIAVAPLSTMRLSDFEITEAQVASLDVFPVHHWELRPASQDSYNLTFRSLEDAGIHSSPWTLALSSLRGLPYETIYPSLHNLDSSAVNFDSLVRWDSQKRRLFASVSTPLEASPRWRLIAHVDGRDENWNLTNSFTGSTSAITAMKLRRAEAGVDIRRIETGRWSWQTGAKFSRRTFGNINGLSANAAPFFEAGNAVEWNVESDYHVLSLPDKRLTLDSSGSASAARFFGVAETTSFVRLTGGLHLHWFPQAEGDDYEINSQFSAGAIAGTAPLDEFFTLGVERDDNDLWLRGISATHDGEKGNSPMGRRYALANLELDKVIYHDDFFEVKAGPTLDAGEISDSSGYFGSRGWLWDPGVECKVRVLDTVEVVFSYGQDVRSGQNTFFSAALP
jgi:hypothetical protein